MILCTGNPTHATVASAVHAVFPTADFASRATGYDLRFWTPGSEDYFCEQVKNYSVFINSSFICGGGQLQLLETTHRVWTQHGITGHIINIGSTAEWDGIASSYPEYSIQKRALRDRSLQLDNKQIKTTHIIAGGLNDGLAGHEQWLSLDQLAQTIKWVLDNPCRIKLISLETL